MAIFFFRKSENDSRVFESQICDFSRFFLKSKFILYWCSCTENKNDTIVKKSEKKRQRNLQLVYCVVLMHTVDFFVKKTTINQCKFEKN